MSNQWSDNLRKRMEDYEEPSPEGLWDNIEHAMKQKKDSAAKDVPLRRKGIVLWDKRIGAAAAVILLLSIVGYNSLRNEKGEAIASLEELSPNHTNIDKNKSADKSQIEDRLVANKTYPLKRSPYIETVYDDEEPIVQNKSEQELPSVKEKEDESPSEPNEEQPIKKYPATEPRGGYDFDMGADINPRHGRKAKWETNLYASNISSGFTDSHGGYKNLAFSAPPIIGNEIQSDPNDALLRSILTKNLYEKVITDINHKQPLVVGASFSYRLNEKWSITSGVTYTKLSSELRSGSDNAYYDMEQDLHYIGIPLNINYQIWGNKNFAVYISGGGVVEKNVSGTLSTNYVLDNNIESTKHEKISIDRLQLSANSFLGIQYNLSGRIGVYAEPGVGYYFKVKSDIETIYKEKPLNPSLRLGIRISLHD